jgi:hypothetical protein
VRASVVLNDYYVYYVEVPAGAMPVGFSWRRLTEYREDQTSRPRRPLHREQLHRPANGEGLHDAT